jgi:LPXTG-motif cell wall-anchored protein
MRKLFCVILALVLGGFFVSAALAQDTEPPLGLPLIDSSTATTTATSESTVTTYSTVTPTTQAVVDNAETGSEIYILAGLSVLAGTGLFLIKKYFDLKKSSL